jgi:hypothetical protein
MELHGAMHGEMLLNHVPAIVHVTAPWVRATPLHHCSLVHAALALKDCSLVILHHRIFELFAYSTRPIAVNLAVPRRWPSFRVSGLRCGDAFVACFHTVACQPERFVLSPRSIHFLQSLP